MAEYRAAIDWSREGETFTDGRYRRRHLWSFDGGVEVPASSSPLVVPLPFSDATCVDPEEAFVASLSSCHMLWFLSIAAERGFVVDSYHDSARGTLANDPSRPGVLMMTRVTLRPLVRFSGDARPDADGLVAMHHLAHRRCFIANSVKSDVRCEPMFEDAYAPLPAHTSPLPSPAP